ncbi:hypothetical protein ACEQPO_22290 [Bacillus sp. SL00103]
MLAIASTGQCRKAGVRRWRQVFDQLRTVSATVTARVAQKRLDDERCRGNTRGSHSGCTGHMWHPVYKKSKPQKRSRKDTPLRSFLIKPQNQ